ncbi:MAG: DUF1360 domain-containing protein [bacterium]
MDTRQDKNKAFWNFFFSVVFAALLAASLWFLRKNGLPRAIPIFDFILLGLAVFRLTHLFVYDHITGWLREFFERFQTGPGKTISNLLSCPWCTGIWVALFVSFAYFATPYAWYVILVFALAGAGTLVEIIAGHIMSHSHSE